MPPLHGMKEINHRTAATEIKAELKNKYERRAVHLFMFTCTVHGTYIY